MTILYNKHNNDNNTDLIIKSEGNIVTLIGCIDFIEKTYFNDLSNILEKFLLVKEEDKVIDISDVVFMNSSAIKVIINVIIKYCETKSKTLTIKKNLYRSLHGSLSDSIRKILIHKGLDHRVLFQS